MRRSTLRINEEYQRRTVFLKSFAFLCTYYRLIVTISVQQMWLIILLVCLNLILDAFSIDKNILFTYFSILFQQIARILH